MFIAERQGFEPWVPVRVQRFSRPSRSTTPASFLVQSAGRHQANPAIQSDFSTAKLQIVFYSAKVNQIFIQVFFILSKERTVTNHNYRKPYC